jgi:hypothetical protein
MMRTLLLVLTGLLIWVNASAQDNIRNGALHRAPEIKNDLLSAETVNPQEDSKRLIPGMNAKNGATAVVIGNSANPFTGVGVRSAFQYVPELNSLMLMHRQDPAISGVGTSGWINFAISTDGGSNWNTGEGPLWNSSVGTDARYPQGFLLNPAGNTDPNNAHAVFMGPTLEATNGTSWGGVGYASRLVGDTGTAVNQMLYQSNAPGRLHYIPDGGTVVGQTIYVVDPVPDWTVGTGIYTDTLAIYKGTINGNQVDFTEQRIHLPVDMASPTGGVGQLTPTSEVIAFAPDGQTGYITMLGRLDSLINPHQTYSLIWMKTTDGGNTWSAPATIDISEDTVLRNQLGGDTTFLVTTAFEQDMVVDKNGNPHCFMNIGLADAADPGFALFGSSSIMYHVWSPDGGINWNFDTVGSTHDFRGFWGDATNNISEDNRPQIARDTSGKYIMFAYFDVDSTFFFTPCANGAADAPCGNIDRTIKYAGYNVDKDFHSELVVDLFIGDALQLSFEVIPEIAMNNGMGIEIPLAYQIMTDRSNYVSPTTHKYQDDLMLTYEQLGDTLTNLQNEIFSSEIGLFPNPVSDELNITFESKNNAPVRIEVMNMLGQMVLSETISSNIEGVNRHTLRTDRLKNGMYILRVSQNEEQVSKKFLKE